MSNIESFISQKLPTFKRAWRLLTFTIGLLFSHGLIYPTTAFMTIAIAMIFYNMHAWRLLDFSWLDNSAYTQISEREEDMILGGVLNYMDSTLVGTDYKYFIDERTYFISRDIPWLARKTALPCLSIKQSNKKQRILYRDMIGSDNNPGNTRFALFTQRESQEVFDGHWEDWGDFRKLYPQIAGIITLSRPGIDATGNIAIVDVGIMGSMLAGRGCIYKLQKISGSWHVVQKYYTWIS